MDGDGEGLTTAVAGGGRNVGWVKEKGQKRSYIEVVCLNINRSQIPSSSNRKYTYGWVNQEDGHGRVFLLSR